MLPGSGPQGVLKPTPPARAPSSRDMKTKDESSTERPKGPYWWPVGQSVLTAEQAELLKRMLQEEEADAGR